MSEAENETSETIRLDKWLWFARFFKTRSLAGKICRARKIRINGALVSKASASVRVGDILTFPKANQIITVKLEALGTRRGPAPEAQNLYEDLSPPPSDDHKGEIASVSPQTGPVLRRERGSGRPTKSERRALDRLMQYEPNSDD